jgi:hypothetical protein
VSFETDLRGALCEHATPISASAELRAFDYRPRSDRVRPHRVGAAVVLLACVTAIALGVAAPWSGGMSLAQAFPVLSGPSTLTPASLSQALRIYGVGAGDDGLDIQHARPIPTPWGKAYVLTNAPQTAVCVAVPAPAPVAWIASCNQAKSARTYGTAPVSYAYDTADDSVRFVALVPAGATASLNTGSRTTPVPIHNDLLAFTAEPGSEIQITIHGRSFADEVTRGTTAQGSSRDSASPAQGSASSTTAAGLAAG